MQFFKKYFFIPLLLLASCAGPKVPFENFYELKSNNQAIVVIRSQGLSSELDGSCLMKLTWENKNTSKLQTMSGHEFYDQRQGEVPHYEAYAIPAGDYQLESGVYFSAEPGFLWGTVRYSNSFGPLADDFITFSVNPGDVVYIGDLTFNAKRSNLVAAALEIKDNFFLAQEYLKKEKPQFAPYLKKRLMEFSEPIKKFKRIDSQLGIIHKKEKRG